MWYELFTKCLLASQSRVSIGARCPDNPVNGFRPQCFPNRPNRVTKPLALLIAMLAFATPFLFALATGSISGTVRDSSGSVIPYASVELRNTQTGAIRDIQTDGAGFYSLPALPVGHYDINFKKTGFGNYLQKDIAIDVDTARQVDAVLNVGAEQQQVTVTTSQAQVETETTQMGEVIGGKEVTNLPLNGRAYTDLLALQPGVVPISTAMYTGTDLSPANSLNNGLLSMAGGQDMHSGFMVNGANTVEGFAGGTDVIPTIDSIAEFRIITSNAGAEYGNYSGGLVNVVTKSGTNEFHGDVFEFVRNTALDAQTYFSPTRSAYVQNQFGGTLGGPILRDKIFFFGDYQGTRQTIGVSTGLIPVPSTADLTGNVSDLTSHLSGKVNGSYWANTLASRLGYTVTAGEPYYTSGCTSTVNCVFPNAVVPQTAWSTVSPNVVKLYPAPNSGQYFTTSANSETLQDDKGAIRIDASTRFGSISGYYHDDPWSNTNPYDNANAGSTLPGFPNTAIGKAQLYVLGDTMTFGSSMVNQFTASYTRNKNIQGLVGTGPSMSSLGFAAPSNAGVYQLSGATYQNWPTLKFNSYTLGAAESVVSQFDNTYQMQDDFTKIVGSHTLKVGGDYHWDQVDITHPNNGSNSIFIFNGTETGSDFVDMLIGAPSQFQQGTPAGLQLRSFYLGIYGQDSWRVSQSLTINYGARWEVTPFWSAQHNLNPVVLLGVQSTSFPTAPVGYAFPGDKGVPTHMANTRWNNVGPRIGLAYTPNFLNPLLHSIFGDRGKSSIRLGFGQYFTNLSGANTWNFAAAPYALFYASPAPPLFAQPFISRASGQNLGQRFPLPPLNPSNVNWAEYEPITGKRNPLPNTPSPYEEHIDFSIERQVTSNTLLSLSYVGTFGHHLTVFADNNPGTPSLCLSVSQPSEVMPGTATCGPNGSSGVYYPITGGVINSTRAPFGPLFGANGWSLDIGNSNYDAFESTLRHTSPRLSLLLSYTFSKAIDNGSGFGDMILLNGNHNHFRNLSAYDLPQNVAASYTYELPLDYLVKKDNSATRGWKLSGLTQFTSGVPVQISEPDDRSLLGNNTNGPFGGSTDEPDFIPGPIFADRNPRDRKPYFNTSLFSEEPLGQQGTSARRFFHGPGINNWNLALLKDVQFKENRSLELRGEFFNVFNHAQFDGLNAVGGNWDSGSAFGIATTAASGRIGQMAAKFMF
jgi:carboxypeptidase family protein